MNRASDDAEEALFQQAVGLASFRDRSAFLDQACQGDPELRARIELLLEGHFAAQGFLDRTPPRPAEAQTASYLSARYTLLEKLGEGGFGVVWLADQLEPVKRRVAIKILKAGMDTGQVVARFEAERQALALMDHPCIARVFDAGQTETGRPYFVMELVTGTKITDYCRQNQLSIAERLQLFVLVCRAIQHAHQKGIIHRDIKPSNILVTCQDDLPAPKVIDFGIAKAMRQELTDRTVVTQLHQFLGTPAYISPEQALMTSDDIDTRSDIYSLGVLLYELLAGKPPFDNHQLLTAGLDEMRRVIREMEPLRPSLQQSETEIDPDLDWIVMKCLEKDRARRYETANGLAMDVQRFLAHEPIVARPPSALYRISKVVRRSPLVVGLSALLVVAAISAFVIGASMNVRLARAKIETDRVNHDLARNLLFLESERMEERGAEGLRSQPMAWLAKRLRSNPSDRAAAARLLSMLNQRNFGLPLFAPLEHDGKVNSAVFTPDEKQIVTAAEDGTVRFWDAQTGRAVRVLSNSVSVAFAGYVARGKRLLVAGHDGVVRLYDPAGASLIFSVPDVRNSSSSSVTEGGRGRWLFVEHSNDTISKWDLMTGTRLEPLWSFPARIDHTRYSEEGACLAVVCADGTIHIRDEVTGKPLAQPRHFTQPSPRAHFPPDGRRLLISSGNHLATWDFRERDDVTEIELPGQADLQSILFTPDGGRMLTWSWRGTMRVWETSSMRVIGDPIDAGVHPSFVLSHNGRLAASVGQRGASLLIDLETAQVLLEPIQHDGRIYSASFSADDSRLLTSSVDGTARLWDIRMRLPVSRPLSTNSSVAVASFNHAGNQAVVNVDANGVQVFDLDSAKPVSPVLRHLNTGRSDEAIRNARFSPADKYILTIGFWGYLQLWDAATYQPLRHMIVGSSLNVAKFSPDGRFIVSGDQRGAATVWDTASGKRLAAATHNGNEVLDVNFHPHAGFFLTSAVDGLARCWTLPGAQSALPPLRHRGIVWTADFSPDGKRIVTASADKTALLWDSRTGQPLSKPLRHSKDIYFALFSPDGRRVVSTSEDGSARVWDAETGEPISPFLRHNAGVWQAAFTPDSRLLATGSMDRTVRLWDPETGLPLSEPFLHPGPISRLSLSPDGRRLLSFGSEARVWSILQPPVPVPTWVCAMVEALAGCSQAADGQLIPAPPAALRAARDLVSSNSSNDFYTRWAKWFLIDRMKPDVPVFRAE